MGLKMENFNIVRVHWEIHFSGGSSRKTKIVGNFLKRKAWTVCIISGGLGKREGNALYVGSDH